MALPPLDDVTRRRLTGRFGTGVAGWLDGLPGRATLLARDWGVTLGEPPRTGGGRTSVVVHGALSDGRPVVLKLTPDVALAAAEASALVAVERGYAEASGGLPLARLLARDDRAGALLLEEVRPGQAIGARPVPPDPAAVGSLLRRLRAVEPGDALPPLAERVAFCFDLVERLAGAAADTAAIARGREQALALAAYSGAPRAFVHGDLHPGNVLDGGPERGLVAIDPRPCIGDPGFDAVDLILWAVEDRAEVERRTVAVAAAAGYDPARLRAWCEALAPISPQPPTG